MTKQEAIQRVSEFFKEEMSPQDFAKQIRIHLHETLLQFFLSKDDDACHKRAMYDGYFWLMLFCERIDPVMGIYEDN